MSSKLANLTLSVVQLLKRASVRRKGILKFLKKANKDRRRLSEILTVMEISGIIQRRGNYITMINIWEKAHEK